MPTRRGRVVLASSVVLYVMARAASISELYALAAACLVFPLAAAVFVRWDRLSVGIERSLSPKRLFAGHEVRISITMRNRGSRLSPPLVLEDDAPPALGGTLRFSTPPLARGQQTTVSSIRRPSLRGRFTVGPLRARVIDPFGLADVEREVVGETSVLVYPRVEVLSDHAPPEAHGGGGRSPIHRVANAGDDFYGVRSWQDGDDYRRIHWRSTARLGDVMVRQDEVRPFPRATLFLDTRASEHRGSGAGSSIEYVVSAAASTVWELARQGFALRLATPDAGPNGARWGREAVDPLLAALAMVERSGVRGLTPSLRRLNGAGAGGALLAFLPPPASDAIATLSKLRRSYHWCGAVLLDTASFLDISTRERAIFDQRLAEADRALGRAGWHVAVAGTSDPYRGVWQRLLAPASRQSSLSRRS